MAPLKRPYEPADRLNALPDEILLQILHRLASTPAAVRTGVLSRRWGRLWSELTELRLDSVLAPVPGAHTVDGALAACSVGAVTCLRVSLNHLPLRDGDAISAARVAAWLQFASERVAGDLCILLPQATYSIEGGLHLPAECDKITEITLWLGDRFRLCLPASGTFATLMYLEIHDALMDCRELEEFVSCHCRRLEGLALRLPRLLGGSDICIRSESLTQLDFHIEGTSRLEVAAPRLERLSVCSTEEAFITAPELGEIVWEGNNFVAHRHGYAEAGRHLRRLVVTLSSWTATLMRRFDTVDELIIDISIPHGENGYSSFIKDVDMLPSCKALVVQSTSTSHGSIPIVLHLLRISSQIKKLVIYLEFMVNGLCKLLKCPCGSPKCHITDDINLDLLEEVEINLVTEEA
ncbi:hypothetical protein QOZ80_7BG0603240 [Eleusine coracana subsp. coracana]|nr:hypothetical protein QOZ80_7BG0603240 [Eleusine coracana subsp. coracana]